MIIPIGFTRDYQFIGFKKAIGHPAALEFLINLFERCQNQKDTALQLPEDFVAPAMGLPPKVDPKVVLQALIKFGLITPAAGADFYDAAFFRANNPKMVCGWENGSKGGRPKKDSSREGDRNLSRDTGRDGAASALPSSTQAPDPKTGGLDEDVPF